MRLHHIAYVTGNAEKKADEFSVIFGWKRLTGLIADENQDVRIVLLEAGDSLLMELIEPKGPKSPVGRHLAGGGGLYHLCFEVDDLDGILKRLEQDKAARIVKPPAAAPAFGGRRVAFIATQGRDLVEFIEKMKP